jgi:hypothetical protein
MWLRCSLAKQVDPGGDVLDKPLECIQQAVSCVCAACDCPDVVLGDAAQIKHLQQKGSSRGSSRRSAGPRGSEQRP